MFRCLFQRERPLLWSDSQEVEKQIIIAIMPVLPIARSYAGATLLADIIIDKYVNHLPFYRQIEMFKEHDRIDATANPYQQDIIRSK